MTQIPTLSALSMEPSLSVGESRVHDPHHLRPGRLLSGFFRPGERNPGSVPSLLLSTLHFPACVMMVFELSASMSPMWYAYVPCSWPSKAQASWSLSSVNFDSLVGARFLELPASSSFPVTNDFLLWDLELGSLPSMR